MPTDTVTTTNDSTVSGVSTPTGSDSPKHLSFAEHYEAAKAAEASKEQPAPAPSDDTASDQTTVEDPDKVADQPPATTDTEDTLLTADEVARLSPKEADLYRKAQKNYTLKTQALAAQRKELEPYQQLISALNDPARAKDTVAQLAQQVGLIQPQTVEQSTVKGQSDELLAELPAELDFLKPVFEQFGQKLLQKFGTQLEPIQKTQSEIVSKTIAESTEATLKSFGDKYKGWEQYESAMMDIMRKVQPSPEMSDFEYLEMAYKLATYGKQSAEQTKRIIGKIEKAAQSAETVQSGVQPERVEHRLPPPDKRTIKDAYEAAKRGERWSS